MSQTRSNAGEDVDGVSDGVEEVEDAAPKLSRAERKAEKAKAGRKDAGGKKGTATKSAPRSTPRKKRTSPSLFIRQIIAEMRKVVWPTRSELTTYTAVVIVFCIAIIGIVALFDFGITHAVTAIFG